MLSVLLWFTDSDYLPWYLLAILLSVLLWFTDSDYPLVSFGHCVVCSSMIYRLWLHPWYFLAIVLSVLLCYTDSDYPLGIFWQLFFFSSMIYGFWLSLGIFGHCVVCSSMIYRFWLHPWYLLAIVLSVLLWYTDFEYPLVSFGHCVVCSMIYRIVITPLLSFGHRVVCSSMIYRFWLQPWYILVIVLSVLLWNTDSDYPLGIFWQLCCLFFYDIQILITPLVSFGHSVVCFSMIYRFWLHPWYLSAIVLSVLLWFMDSDFLLGILWQLCFLFFYDLHILIIPWYLLDILLFVLLWFTHSDYPLGFFWPLCFLFFYDLHILITPLVSFGHCVFFSSMIYRFWLHPWYLLAILLSVLLWYTDSDYPLGIFWPLGCLFFYDIQILLIPLVSFGHCVVFSSMIYRFWLPLGIFWKLCCVFFYDLQILINPLVSFGHCVVFSSMIYRFWLPLGIFWPLCCVFFYDLQILIIPLVSFGHCVVFSSMIYRFWLHPWYPLVIVLSVLLWNTDSDYPLGIFWPMCCLFFYEIDSYYPLGIFWPLCCLFFYDLQILITPMVSFGHLFFYDIQILITPLVSFGHCVICSSMI